VAYAYLVDTDGQILAPLEERGDFLDWPAFSSAVAKEAVTVGEGKKGEQILFYPLKVFNQLRAAAVVGFASGTADSSESGTTSAGTFALLFVLMVLGGGLAAVALKIFLKPLQNLEEEVRVALKNNQTELNFKAPYREIEELAQAFSRLLTKPSVPSPPSAWREEKPVSPTSESGKKTSDIFQELDGLDTPWCVLDTAESQVARYNDGFRALCDNPKLTGGMHILEVFQQPNMLRAVSSLVDAPDQVRAEIEDTDPPMQIQKRPVPEGTGQIILIFEEQSHV
jgi:HAMP domain-containing protein